MLYLAVYILNLLDLLTTHLAVNVWQVATEGNLLMAPIVGHWAIVPIKVAGIGIVLWILWRKRRYRVARGGGIFLLILYMFIVASNTLVLLGIL